MDDPETSFNFQVKTLTPNESPPFLYDSPNDNPALKVHLEAVGFREITHELEKSADNRSECVLSISASPDDRSLRFTLSCEALSTEV